VSGKDITKQYLKGGGGGGVRERDRQREERGRGGLHTLGGRERKKMKGN